MNPRFRDAFRRFNDAAVTYCVLRDGEQLDRFEGGGDIDLLVQVDQLPVLERELVKLGFVSLQRWGNYPHHQFVLDDPGSNSLLKFDVVTVLWFGGSVKYLRTDLAAKCLERRRALGDVYVVAPEDEIVLLLLHCVIDKREFRPPRRRRLQSLRSSVTDMHTVTTLLRTYWQSDATWEQMTAYIDREDWEGLLKRRPAVIAHLRRGDSINSVMRKVRQRVLRKLDRWTSKLRLQLMLPMLSADQRAHAKREFRLRWNSRTHTSFGYKDAGHGEAL